LVLLFLPCPVSLIGLLCGQGFGLGGTLFRGQCPSHPLDDLAFFIDDFVAVLNVFGRDLGTVEGITLIILILVDIGRRQRQ